MFSLGDACVSFPSNYPPIAPPPEILRFFFTPALAPLPLTSPPPPKHNTRLLKPHYSPTAPPPHSSPPPQPADRPHTLPLPSPPLLPSIPAPFPPLHPTQHPPPPLRPPGSPPPLQLLPRPVQQLHGGVRYLRGARGRHPGHADLRMHAQVRQLLGGLCGAAAAQVTARPMRASASRPGERRGCFLLPRESLTCNGSALFFLPPRTTRPVSPHRRWLALRSGRE